MLLTARAKNSSIGSLGVYRNSNYSATLRPRRHHITLSDRRVDLTKQKVRQMCLTMAWVRLISLSEQCIGAMGTAPVQRHLEDPAGGQGHRQLDHQVAPVRGTDHHLPSDGV